MPAAPKVVIAKITALLLAWLHLRPNKLFSGLSREEFSGIVQPSIDLRKEIAECEARLLSLTAQREKADEASMNAVRRVVCGVQGDPEEGEDGELYSAMGFVRKSQRSSGLTRRRKSESESGQENVEVRDDTAA